MNDTELKVDLFSPFWRRALFSAGFAVAVPIPAIFVGLGRVDGAWVLVLAGTAGMLLTRLGDVKSFALGPLKAELETQIIRAKAAADIASATTEQLRNLAVALAAPVFSTTLSTLNYHGPREPRYQQKEAIVRQLRDLGVPEHDILGATVAWRRWAELDHQERIINAMNKTLSERGRWPENFMLVGQEVSKLRAAASPDQGITAAAFSALAQRLGLQTQEADEFILDYEHFKKTDALRRPEVLKNE